MLTINEVCKSFGQKEVLKSLNLSLGGGLIHGLIGENGAGKTTLFECMNRLLSFQGSIQINAPRGLGYLPTGLFFYPNMKGLEYVEFCLVARKLKVDYSLIHTMNALFELPLNQYALEYSTGMKKKLALMAIFLQNNDFIILDELFNGLDLTASIVLKKLILRFKENNKTVLLSSHILSSLTDICDQVHLLHDGSIERTYLPNDYQHLESNIIDLSIKDKMDIIEGLSQVMT